jgi:hypothetical protein
MAAARLIELWWLDAAYDDVIELFVEEGDALACNGDA